MKINEEIKSLEQKLASSKITAERMADGSEKLFDFMEKDKKNLQKKLEELIDLIDQANEKGAMGRIDQILSFESRTFIQDLIDANLAGDFSEMAKSAEKVSKEVSAIVNFFSK